MNESEIKSGIECDLRYELNLIKEAVVSQAITKFNNPKKLIRLDNLIDELEDLIVDAHDGKTDTRSFKGI